MGGKLKERERGRQGDREIERLKVCKMQIDMKKPLLMEKLKWGYVFLLIIICSHIGGGVGADAAGPEVIKKGNFQFNVYKKNESVALALVKDSETINQQVRSYYDMKMLNDLIIIIDLVDPENESAVVQKDYINLPAWVAAYALPPEHRIIIRYKNVGSYPYLELKGVVKHELSHVYLWYICNLNHVTVPKWFDEGLAMYIEKKWGLDDYYQVAMGALRARPIPIRNLMYAFPQDEYEVKIAYVESFSLVSYMVEVYGQKFLSDLLSKLSQGQDFFETVNALTGSTMDQIAENWQNDIFRYYRWIPIFASTGFLWIIITLFTLWLYMRKRRRNKRIMERWEEDEKIHYT